MTLLSRVVAAKYAARGSAETYVHGSPKPLSLGAVFKARPFVSEFANRISVDGVSIEDFFESHRPSGAVPRLNCVYAGLHAEDLNKAGASTDYVYLVTPVGKTTTAHWGWFQLVLGLIWEKQPLKGNAKAEKYVKSYWSRKFCPGSTGVWEVLCEGCVILREV